MTSVNRRILALGLLCPLAAAPGQGNSLALSFVRPTWTAPEAFSSLRSVRELRDGTLLVCDAGERRVHMVLPGGQSSRVLGRTGSGPSEYTNPTVLLPLPGDSSLLVDEDARRYLTIAPNGTLTETKRFPKAMDKELVRGADPAGRLYVQANMPPDSWDGPPMVAVRRWDRRSTRFDSVFSVRVPNPRSIDFPLTDELKRLRLVSMRYRPFMPYIPVDDWAIAPSGRVAVLRAIPYRLDWIELDGRVAQGEPVAYRPIPVTAADMRQRGQKARPYSLRYPKTKPPFQPGIVIDDLDSVWVRREGPAGARDVEWDVFSSKGERVRTVSLPANKRIVAITLRYVYVIRTDSDDLQWLEAYAR